MLKAVEDRPDMTIALAPGVNEEHRHQGHPGTAVIRVINGSWGGVIEAQSGGVVEVGDDVREEVGSFGLVVFGGVVALAGENGDELGQTHQAALSFVALLRQACGGVLSAPPG